MLSESWALKINDWILEAKTDDAQEEKVKHKFLDGFVFMISIELLVSA